MMRRILEPPFPEPPEWKEFESIATRGIGRRRRCPLDLPDSVLHAATPDQQVAAVLEARGFFGGIDAELARKLPNEFRDIFDRVADAAKRGEWPDPGDVNAILNTGDIDGGEGHPSPQFDGTRSEPHCTSPLSFDPGLAALCIALNGVCVGTSLVCDGHGQPQRLPVILLASHGDALWCSIVVELAARWHDVPQPRVSIDQRRLLYTVPFASLLRTSLPLAKAVRERTPALMEIRGALLPALKAADVQASKDGLTPMLEWTRNHPEGQE